MRIKQIEEQDIPAICKIEQDNFTRPWGKGSLEGFVDNPAAVFLKAQINEELAGYCLFLLSFDTGDLYRIAVKPERKRQGVGARLLEEGLLQCGQKGADRILLEVRASNTPAIALYQKHFFQELGRRKGYYTQPAEDAVIMCRSLPEISTIQKRDLFL